MNQTLVLCKPDAVERGLIGEIISRFEQKGLSIKALRMLTIGSELAQKHYAEHVEKPFYDDLATFIGRSPAVAMIVEGPEDTWSIVRKMMGATNAADAEPGTIRGDLSAQFTENLVHGSDSAESAEREIQIFFPER
jgi:nucleoside-diphosphate kinase